MLEWKNFPLCVFMLLLFAFFPSVVTPYGFLLASAERKGSREKEIHGQSNAGM